MDGKLTDYNIALKRILGLDRNEDIRGMDVLNYWMNPADRNIYIEKLLENGFIEDFELMGKRHDGATIIIQVNSRLIYDKKGKPLRIEGSFLDVSTRKQAEVALKKAYNECEDKVEKRTIELKELNTALTVLLRKSDKDRVELEEKILLNIKELIIPILRKLATSQLDDKQRSYINTIETNLNNIISPFSRVLSSKYSSLTPKEIQIAKLIKEGKTSKEIAELIASNKNAIEFHRKNLTRKLGLRNTKINLRTHLQSLN